jgi:hypothetical protein
MGPVIEYDCRWLRVPVAAFSLNIQQQTLRADARVTVIASTGVPEST